MSRIPPSGISPTEAERQEQIASYEVCCDMGEDAFELFRSKHGSKKRVGDIPPGGILDMGEFRLVRLVTTWRPMLQPR